MRYLLDTSVCIDYFHGVTYAGPLLRALSADGTDEFGISLATYGELLAGIPYTREPQTTERGVLVFLRLARILPLTRGTMREFARLKAELSHTGQLIGDFDTLIAATALHHGLTPVTRNRKHFERIPELSLHVPN